MKKNKYNQGGFTLIEILVSITILSIILISVFTIYISSTDINLKTDITRALQQNVKTSIEKLSEDIRKNGYDCIKADGDILNCDIPVYGVSDTLTGTYLKTNIGEYYLGKKIGSTYSRVSVNDCDDINESCVLVLNSGLGTKPIMNSWVDVKDLEFRVTNHGVKKVTVLMTLQPALGKGIKPSTIINNKFHFQTTISERSNLN